MRKDWWHTTFGKSNVPAMMGGNGGREGTKHPTHTWFADHIPDGSSLLDVGCCNAHALISLREHGKTVDYTGVDQLQECIDWNLENVPDAKFAVSDASDLRDFEDNSFDYVLSRHVIEHLNHYSQHIMEMFRVARKEVVIVGFLELRDNLDRLQYGMKDEGGSWYNQYSQPNLEFFIEYNLTKDYEIIPSYQDMGHPIIIIRKGKNET